MTMLVFSLYILALIIQTGAVLVCWSAFSFANRFRSGWVVLSIGLLLMLGRRLGPIWAFDRHRDIAYGLYDSSMSLVISLLLFAGVMTIRHALIDLNNKNKELDFINRFDMLTHATSRAEMMRLGRLEIERSLRNRMPLAVIELDIDRFKNINDQYGHQVGDEVLKSLTQHCQMTLRANDFFGRVGGEEFVILLPETTASRAMDAAERIRMTIASAEHHTSASKTISITISLGVSIFEPASCMPIEHDELFKQQLDRADQAMYQAKRSGRNCVRMWNTSTPTPEQSG